MSSSPPESTSRPSTRRRLGFWFALIGAIAFSGKAIVVKLLIREGVDGITSLGLRMLLAAPAFVLMATWNRRSATALSRADVRSIALLGCTGYYAASTLDFLGLEHVSAGLERLILYVYPTIVLVMGRLRGQPPIQARQWIAMGVAYAGVVVAFGS